MNENEIFNNYLQERRKHNTISELGSETMNQMGVAVMVMAFSEHFLPETHTKSFHEILTLLKESRTRGAIVPELASTIERNFARIIAMYETYKLETFKNILGERFKEYTYLSQQSSKTEFAEKIRFACFNNKVNQRLVDRYDILKRSLRMFDPKIIQITPASLKVQIDKNPDEILLGLASIIDDPSRLAYQREILDPDYDKFPLKWYGLHMTIVDFRMYYKRFKAGENIDDYVEQYVDSKTDIIKKVFNDHYFIKFAEREVMVQSVLESYSSGNYPATICTCLPLIEGSILAFAEYYHFCTGGIFANKEGKTHLILKTGNQTPDFTIGLLLKNSALSTFFDEEFISYFCNDLYAERNPILHGAEVTKFSKLDAAKKILTFSYVTEVMDAFIFKQYQKDMDKSMDEEIYRKLTTGIKLSDEEKFSIKVQEIKASRFVK